MTVTWSEIKAECGDYRAGFVSTFKKYEGLPTDERDKQGRTVKVTAASFARHTGIPRQTFQAWVAAERGARRRRHEGRDESGAKKVLRDPELRRRLINDLDPDERSAIVRDISRTTTSEPRDDDEVGVPDLDEAVAADLTAQVAKLVHTASRIDVLLIEHDALFKRIDADEAARLDDDLERAVKTIRAVRAELLKHREIEVQA